METAIFGSKERPTEGRQAGTASHSGRRLAEARRRIRAPRGWHRNIVTAAGADIEAVVARAEARVCPRHLLRPGRRSPADESHTASPARGRPGAGGVARAIDRRYQSRRRT